MCLPVHLPSGLHETLLTPTAHPSSPTAFLNFSVEGLKGEPRKQMKAALAELAYVCSSPLVPDGHPLEKVLYTKGGLTCRTPMETQFFTTGLAGRDTDICGICGLAEHELEQPPANMASMYSFVQPTCTKCRAAGEKFLHGRCSKNAAARAKKQAKTAERTKRKADKAAAVAAASGGSSRAAKRPRPRRQRRQPSSEEEEVARSSSEEEPGSSGED